MIKFLLVVVLLKSISSFASDTTILASCDPKGEGQIKLTMPEFVKILNEEKYLGKNGVRIAGNALLPQSVDVAGVADIYKSKSLTILKFSDSSIEKFSKKYNSDPNNKNLGYLHNLREFFENFQMGVAGACEFLVPTRFEVITDGFKSKSDSDDKIKLLACEKKLEESCEAKSSVIDNSARDAKAVEIFLDKKEPAASGVSK